MLCSGCANSKIEAGERQMSRPINCATAEGDIRLLRHEKAHVAEQIKAGMTSIVPASAVVGMATGQEGENIKVATGDYNRRIDARIAEIKRHCGLK